MSRFEHTVQQAGEPRYRFGFVLTTLAGNMTRYLILRKFAERDTDVECIWAPVRHYLEPDEPSPWRWLPGPLLTRAIVMQTASPVLKRMWGLDAVMYHAFEPYVLAVVRSLLFSRPLIVWSADNPPFNDDILRAGGLSPKSLGVHKAKWRRTLRFWFDCWSARQVDVFLPFSSWARAALINYCDVPDRKISVFHTGLDLERWCYRERPVCDETERLNILFVGGDYYGKGGDRLTAVYRQHFADRANLHLVTRTRPEGHLPPGVQVYTGLRPDDDQLQHLYLQADLFVLPTRHDMSSWVAIEALASGIPVIASAMGGIPDIVRDGETGFLIPPDDDGVLVDRMRRLLADGDLRRRMGRVGRSIVEREFNAAVNVPRILDTMKQHVDRHRFQRAQSGATYGR